MFLFHQQILLAGFLAVITHAFGLLPCRSLLLKRASSGVIIPNHDRFKGMGVGLGKMQPILQSTSLFAFTTDATWSIPRDDALKDIMTLIKNTFLMIQQDEVKGAKPPIPGEKKSGEDWGRRSHDEVEKVINKAGNSAHTYGEKVNDTFDQATEAVGKGMDKGSEQLKETGQKVHDSVGKALDGVGKAAEKSLDGAGKAAEKIGDKATQI